MSTLRYTLATLLLSSALLFSCCGGSEGDSTDNASDSTLRGDLSISGAFALYPLAVEWGRQFEALHPDVRVNISGGGAGKGLTDALSGGVELGMVSRDISPEELAQGAWWVSVAKDAVLPTISADNPAYAEIMKKGITKAQFEEIFIKGTITDWKAIAGGNGGRINVYTRADAAGAAESWAKYMGAYKQEYLKGVGVNGDPALADAVKKDPSGIGFNNVAFVYDMQSRKPFPNLAVAPIDINSNGILDADENFYAGMDDILKALNEGRYPSPPARDLLFVHKGKPTDRIVTEFLKFVLTQGQQYVAPTGLIALQPDKISGEVEKLK